MIIWRSRVNLRAGLRGTIGNCYSAGARRFPSFSTMQRHSPPIDILSLPPAIEPRRPALFRWPFFPSVFNAHDL